MDVRKYVHRSGGDTLIPPWILEGSSLAEVVKEKVLNPWEGVGRKYHFLYRFIKFDKIILDRVYSI